MKKFSKTLLSALLALSVVGTATACEMPEQLQGVVDQIGGMIGILPETPENPEDPETPEDPENPGGETPETPADPGEPGAPTKYTVTFDEVGGSEVADAEYAVGDAYTLPTTTKKGYTFDGWYNGDTKMENGDWTLETSVTLTASWTPNTYTIVFSSGAQQATVPMNTTVTYKATYDVSTLANIVPAATGYQFKGWKLEGSEIVLSELEDMSGEWDLVDEYDGTADGTMTFVAQWAKVYKIVYVSNSAAVPNMNGLPTTYVEGEELTLQSVTDTNNDYTFGGWMINGTICSKIDSSTIDSIDGDTITLVAKWADKGNWTKNY